MVDSVAYRVRNGQWAELTQAAHQKKGQHAKRQLFNNHTTYNHLLFLQDAAPCESCHAFFLQQSAAGSRSFIFVVSGEGSGKSNKGSGYPILAGTNVTPTYLRGVVDGEGNKAAQETKATSYRLTSHAQIDTSQLPLTLFYYNGQEYLDLRPVDFPQVPSLAQFRIRDFAATA